jgi:hypothetical protein
LAALPNLKCAILYTSRRFKDQAKNPGPNSIIHFGLGDVLDRGQLHVLDLRGLYQNYHDITAATLSLQPELRELRLPWMINNKNECVLGFIADAGLHRLQTLIVGTFIIPNSCLYANDADAVEKAFLWSIERFVYACPKLIHLCIQSGSHANIDPWTFLGLVSQLPNLRTLETPAKLFKYDAPALAMPLVFPSLTTLDLLPKSSPNISLIAGLCATPWPHLRRFVGGMGGHYDLNWQAEDVTALLANAPHLKELQVNAITTTEKVDEILRAVCEAAPLPHLSFLHVHVGLVEYPHPYSKAKLALHLPKLKQACPRAFIHIAFGDRCRMYRGKALNLRGKYTECIKPPCEEYSEHFY